MSEVHRVALVGCGNVSDMHVTGCLAHPDRVRVVAACDPDAERRRHVEQTHGVPITFATLDELLAGPDFDTAIVCTPSSVRVETVRTLARAGRNVLVEKPLAESLDEAQEMVRTCATEGVLLAVDQNFRDHYAFGLARDAIRAGEIGRVIGIDHRELLFREVSGWRATARHHALSVMGVHWVDGFRYLLPDDADWVVARTFSSPAVQSAGETDAFVQIHFGEATVNYTQSFSSRIERVETIVLGESGTLCLTYGALEVLTADGRSRTRENPCAGAGKPESAYRSLERLVDAIDHGDQPANSGTDNLKTVALVDAAYRSAREGRPVALHLGLPQ